MYNTFPFFLNIMIPFLPVMCVKDFCVEKILTSRKWIKDLKHKLSKLFVNNKIKYYYYTHN